MVGGNVEGNDEGGNVEGGNDEGGMLRGAMMRGVMRGVMRVRVGVRRVVSQWRVITKILMQRGLKERVEGVDVVVMRCMMMMLSPTWHIVTFLYTS
jgi:hypothetical protein